MTRLTKPPPSPDRSKIITGEPQQVKYWTKELGVSEEELKKAIDKVGSAAAAVRKELAARCDAKPDARKPKH